MASTLMYLSSAIAFILVALFLLIKVIKNSMDSSTVIATPSIPLEDAILTSSASTTIKASPDEVFSTLLQFNSSSAWSQYKWEDVDVDGVPVVGSPGTFKLTVDDLVTRKIPIKLTTLDRERRVISEATTHYPKWLLSSERVQEVLPIEGEPGFCEYRTYHTLEGLASYYLLLASREELAETQRRCASDLKAFIEEKAFSKARKQ